ncbi:aldo-keto reductase [Viridothelium virens]|uniref:Aldo-keto reductase n=1 Tax=Viridothelium virens TaxID=1048519 RepID=A0A6A6HCP9_VIRVR|nr:aldo-keto reductase [Viridothelium virens]
MAARPIPDSIQNNLNDTKVEYVQLGTSGLRVSSPILGAMGIGSKKWMNMVIEEDEGLELLRLAWERGVSTWDTANVYSNGISEEIIGKAIKTFGIPRHKLTILTKCMGTVPEDPSIFNWPLEPQLQKSKEYINHGGLSRGAIFRAVNASLKRLGTDYIDLLQIHRYDTSVSPEETMKALHDLIQAGKVHYIGESSMWAYQFARMQSVAEMNGWTKFVSMQNQYNLCYREEEREMNKFCNETGVGLIPWSPLFGGLLSKPIGVETARSKLSLAFSGGLTDADEKIIKRVQEIANRKGWKMSQVALAWLRGKGCIPVVGLNSTSIERLDETCAVRDMRLTVDDLKYLEELYVPKPVNGHS